MRNPLNTVGCLMAAVALMLSHTCLAVKPPQMAPAFSAPATTQTVFNLLDYRGKYLIMVFYPADFTPGCTVQLCSLRDQYQQVKAGGAEVVGINPASVESHQAFAQKHRLPFPLLADKNNQIARAFAVGNSWGFNTRTVFIVGPTGRVLYRQEGMPDVSALLKIITTDARQQRQASHG